MNNLLKGASDSVVFPSDEPVFIGPRRPDDQVPLSAELINAGKVLADEKIARNRTLDVMGQGVLRFIQVVAAEGSLVPVPDVLIG